MKNSVLFSILAVGALALAACAGTPANPDSQAQTSVSETDPAAPTAPDAPDAPAEPAAPMDAELAEAARGYTEVKKNGERYFCRRERATGSNLTESICLTESQLRMAIADRKKYERDLSLQGRRCAQGANCERLQ